MRKAYASTNYGLMPQWSYGGESQIKSSPYMTEIFPGSLPYPSKTLHHVVMCCAICFIWTFLGLTEKPHSYYVGNIKGCVATRAEVESVGGLWHTPRFFSTRPPKTCMQCECSRCARPCGNERGSHPASNEAVLQWTSTWFKWEHHWMPSAKHLPQSSTKPYEMSNISMLFYIKSFTL